MTTRDPLHDHHLIDLTVDHLSDPSAIATARPRFAWQTSSRATGVLQDGYEIEVRRDGDVIWATGPVASGRSSGIEYSGAPLRSRDRLSWRVRTTVTGGTRPSPWSGGTFAVSLLSPDDWQASWVTPEQDPTIHETYSLAGALSGTEMPDTPPSQRLHPPLHLRQEFETPGTPVRARLYATARGIYQAEINGRRVGDEELAPGFDSYPRRLSFQSYDVTALLRAGRNAIGMVVADGWWSGRIGLSGSSATYGDRLAALWQLEMEFADGTTGMVGSGDGVRSARGPRDYADLFIGERYDATRELAGWSEPLFDDSAWKEVAVEPGGHEILVPFAGEPVRATREIRPARILRTPDDDLVIDLGQVIAGRMRVAVRAPRGTVVTLEHSEVLDATGRFFSNVMGPNKDQTDVYVAAGRDGETVEPAFTFHGFRYVRVTGLPDLTSDDATGVVIASDLRETSSFTSSDARLDRLHQNVIWSQRANFLSIPTDCPQRERAGWTGDLQVFMPTAATNADVLPFVERWLANLRADQLADGQVPMIVPVIPSVTEDNGMGIGTSSAGWSDAVVMVPWTLYERTGDPTPLRENYEAMRVWVGYQMREAEGGLPPRLADQLLTPEQLGRQRLLWNTGFHFGDWLAPSTMAGGDVGAAMIAPMRTGEIVAAMFHTHCLALLARIAGILGEDDDAAAYGRRSDQVRAAFAAEYVDDEGRLPVDMQGPYVVALAFDLVPDDRRAASLGHLVDLIHQAGDHLDTGFVSVPYLLDVLWDGGERDLAWTILEQDTVPSWLYEVDRGATTIWEAWAAIGPDGTVSPMSMNHYAFGCVDDWLFRRAAGIVPVEPGYRRARIAPDLGGSLDHVDAWHDTPAGRLSVTWKKDAGSVWARVTVPHNTEVELDLGAVRETLGSGTHERRVRIDPASASR